MDDEDVDLKIDLYTTYIAEDLGERARYRFSPSIIAEHDLERFYYYLRLACPTFTLGEGRALVSALDARRQDLPPLGHHTLFPNVDPPLLWAYVADARERNPAFTPTAWGPAPVDFDSLITRLKTLSAFETLAILDAIERASLDDLDPKSRNRRDRQSRNEDTLVVVGLARSR